MLSFTPGFNRVGADLGLRNRFNGFPLREIALTTTQLKQGVNERSTYIFLAKKESKVSRRFTIDSVL